MSTAETIEIESPPAEVLADSVGSPYLFSVDDFYRMIDADIFPDEARVGLWDGRIYERMAKKQPHAVASSKVITALIRALPNGWFLSSENPITIGHDKAPLPDMMVLRGEPDDYAKRRPTVADVGLVIELSDSSLRADTGPKLAGYAAAGVPAYWVLNLVADVIHIYESPIAAERRYASKRIVPRGGSCDLILDGTNFGAVAARDLLPGR